MKKYLFLIMLIMSVIFVVPAMAETGNGTESVETAEKSTETAISIETAASPESTVSSETLASSGTSETSNESESQGPKLRRKGPGEPYETVEEETTAPEETEETAAPVPGNRWGLTLNAAEIDILARITMLESGGESDLGQQAVVEVILNRVYSPAYPNNVTDVLSQVDCGYRQFSTWKSRNSSRATPSARVMANVNAVLEGNTNVLPYETVYFSRKAANKRVQARIGNHVFCNR